MARTTTRFLPPVDIRTQFAGLSKENPEDRIKAAKALNVLIKNTTTDREQAVRYSLTRLIKGLTSQDDSSRMGFSLALAELLHSLLDESDPLSTELHFRSIVQLLVEHTEPNGNLTKQEERGFYFGRLFGLQAVIETGLLFTKDADSSKWQSVLGQLILLAQKKPWLRESCCLVIRNAALSMDDRRKDLIKLTCEELEKSGIMKTSDGIGIWISLLQKHRSIMNSLHIQFQTKASPLEKSYLQSLAKILKESEGKDEEGNQKVTQKGSWNARLSWVWDTIFEFYTSQPEINQDVASFGEFWAVVVNDGLFSNNASEERKFWGFLVFNKALATFDDRDTVSALFSPNFMKCFINQLSSPERYLYKAAQKSLRVMKTKAETNPALVSTLLTNLLSNNGTPNFESATKVKVIEPLFSFADEQGAADIVKLFTTLILQPDADDEKTIEKSRQWAVDQLLAMIRNSKLQLNESWVSKIVEFLVDYGHFHIQSLKLTSELAFSPATQAILRGRLTSCLSELLHNTGSRNIVWPAKAIIRIQENRENGDRELAIAVDDTINEQITKVFKIVSRLDKKSPKLGSRQYAFELMYSLLLLQLFNGEPEAMDMIEDLHIVYESVGKSEKKSRKEGKKEKHRHKRQKNDEQHDHEPEEEGGLEILVELLLGFLAKPSVLAKKMSQTVFKSFADSVGGSALEALVRPLAVNENQEGQRELFDIEDEDEEMDDVDSSDDGEDEDEEMGSDVEIIDAEIKDSGDSEAEDDSDSEEDSEGENEDDDDSDTDTPLDEETQRLHAALAEALGTSNTEKNDDDEDSDSSMDDDQMMLVDEQLSKIFKQRKAPNKKQQKASAKESVVNFKNRVLELLEIYAKSDARLDDKVIIIPPCLEAIRKTGNQTVRSHAQNVLKSLTQVGKKKGDAKDKDEENKETELGLSNSEAAFEILQQIHEESKKQGQSREHANSCSQCSLFISKLLIASNKSWIPKVTQLYFSETMVNWMTDAKSGTQPAMFTDFVTWAGTVRKVLTKPPLKDEGEKLELNGKKDKKRKRKGGK